MPEPTQQMMHPDFPRWYREVDVEENRDRLQRRWTGLSSMIPSLDAVAIENLLRIVFRSRSAPSSEAVAKLRQAFKDADDLFDMEKNDRELEILSACVLAVCMESDGNTSAKAAIGATTSALNGKRTLQLPMDLISVAENAIARIAENNRKRPDLHTARMEKPKLSLTKAKEKLVTIDVAGIGAALDATAETINLALAAMVNKFNAYATSSADYIAIQDEELEMLWWVLGERSDGVKKSFSAIPKKERPLVFGAELADATVYLPGPLSIDGLLVRAGLKADQSLSIPDTVNACDESWLKQFGTNSTASPLSQPIHFAIQRKLETGDETSWVSGWSGSSGVEATATFSALSMGKLFYRERLLSMF